MVVKVYYVEVNVYGDNVEASLVFVSTEFGAIEYDVLWHGQGTQLEPQIHRSFKAFKDNLVIANSKEQLTELLEKWTKLVYLGEL